MHIAIAPLNFQSILEEELKLKKVNFQLLGDGTYLLPEAGPDLQLWWAAQHWKEGSRHRFESISQAAKQLVEGGPKFKHRYYFHPTTHVRRMNLIGEKLLQLDLKKRITFLEGHDLSLPPMLNVTMLGKDEFFLSQHATPKRPAGIYEFVEDKVTPPNRAYLKLWEFFTRFAWPTANSSSTSPSLLKDVAIDLGSSPGGWTWVLSHFFQEVISIDKAPLEDRILNHQNPNLGKVSFMKQNAFALNPKDFPQVSWLFCDVIAYPSKTLEMIQKWLSDGHLKNFVCTIKLQGKTDFAAIEECSKIPGSHVIHLHNNKHELTWYKLQNLG
ncbi:MAG: SAM-dependent methyltransferase [Bacteriovoracaceae bacterium]|nr:SAM-dependent methyltransferase [Bacteriovoracaceae bacterium]